MEHEHRGGETSGERCNGSPISNLGREVAGRKKGLFFNRNIISRLCELDVSGVACDVDIRRSR